jgi:hypothetical protein
MVFYERLGAEHILCVEKYFVVDFSEPGRRAPMLLMWHPLRPSESQPKGDYLRVILRAIFDLEYSRFADQDFLTDLLAEVRC